MKNYRTYAWFYRDNLGVKLIDCYDFLWRPARHARFESGDKLSDSKFGLSLYIFGKLKCCKTEIFYSSYWFILQEVGIVGDSRIVLVVPIYS